jgi:hypothetical protein
MNYDIFYQIRISDHSELSQQVKLIEKDIFTHKF